MDVFVILFAVARLFVLVIKYVLVIEYVLAIECALVDMIVHVKMTML